MLDGEWSHVAACIAPTSLRLYLDGDEYASLTLPHPVAAPSSDDDRGMPSSPSSVGESDSKAGDTGAKDGEVRVGQSDTGHFRGAVRRVILFGVELSAHQVRELTQ